MKTIVIEIKDRIAKCITKEPIVCGNSDYQIKFEFDSEEWTSHDSKMARFIAGGEFFDIEFTGDTCTAPIFSKVDRIEVGVYVEDVITSSAATVFCKQSICCKEATEIIDLPPVNIIDPPTVTVTCDFSHHTGDLYYTTVENGEIVSKKLVFKYKAGVTQEIQVLANSNMWMITDSTMYIPHINYGNKERFPPNLQFTFMLSDNQQDCNMYYFDAQYTSQGYYLSIQA